MKIEKKFAHCKHYGDKRNTNDIDYIVVKSIDDKPITHYHIVNESAVQLIPDDHISDSVNGAKMCAKGYLHGICTRYNSVSIGVSDKMSRDDIQTLINLIMTLRQRYKVKNENVIRLKDVTGECNPEILYDDDSWKKDIKDMLIEV